jgi:hypothetical protein
MWPDDHLQSRILSFQNHVIINNILLKIKKNRNIRRTLHSEKLQWPNIILYPKAGTVIKKRCERCGFVAPWRETFFAMAQVTHRAQRL